MSHYELSKCDCTFCRQSCSILLVKVGDGFISWKCPFNQWDGDFLFVLRLCFHFTEDHFYDGIESQNSDG